MRRHGGNWCAVAVGALMLLPAWAETVSIHFATVPKTEIERRLNAVEQNNVKRGLKLRELFEAAGCAGDHLSEQVVKHTKAPNVICALPGESDAVILVGGHF